MKLDDLIFLLATLILWLPFPSLSDRFRTRSLLAHYSSPEMDRVWRSWQSYIDLLRGALGAYVVARMGLKVSTDALGFETLSPSLPIIVLALGVLFQIVRLPIPLIIVAPVFYVSGLTLVLPAPLEGAFALLFGWGFALSTKDIRHQLPAMGLALLLAGVFNSNLDYWLLANAAFALTPPFLSLLLNKRLIFVATDRRHSRKRAKAAQPGNAEIVGSSKLPQAQLSSNS
jgi:hypothetical protein